MDNIQLCYIDNEINKIDKTKEEHDEMVKIGNELPKSPPTTLSFNIRLDKMAK